MPTTTSPRHPFKALVAVAAMAVLAHGACARANPPVDDDVTRVDIVGQMPLEQACPETRDGVLEDRLLATWADVQRPSSVVVHFKVQGVHVYDVQPETGSPRTRHQIRTAVHGLRCDGGDEQPHAVRFVITFVDGDTLAAPARVALADTEQ